MPDSVKERDTKALAKKLATVVAHPLRARAWLILLGRAASPQQIADQLGENVHDVDYHVKVLKKARIVEIAAEEPVRGSTRHIYRAIERPILDTEMVGALPEEDAISNGLLVLQLLFADSALALDAGTLVERRDHALVRAPMMVDEQGWRELSEETIEHSERCLSIQGRASERLRGSGEAEIPATVGAILIETPDSRHLRADA